MPDIYQIDFEDFQEAFIKEIITLEQFVEVLIDNFGYVKARQILKYNLKQAYKQERREQRALKQMQSQIQS